MNINIALLICNIFIHLLYLPLNKRKSKHYWKSKLDNYIPIIRISIVPYVLFFPYIVGVYILLWQTAYSVQFQLTLALTTALSAIFWYCVPNGCLRELRPESDVFSRIINFFYIHDSDTNAFPSGHVSGSIIASYFGILAFPEFTILFIILGTMIASSTVFTKQHNVIDILGGVMAFLLGLSISTIILR